MKKRQWTSALVQAFERSQGKKNEERDLTRIHGRKNECVLLFCFLLLLVLLLQREQEGSETFLRINVCCLLCKRARSQAAPFSPLEQNYERTKVSKKSKTWVFVSRNGFDFNQMSKNEKKRKAPLLF